MGSAENYKKVKDSKKKHCIYCNWLLGTTGVKDLLICMNQRCPRYGLFTMATEELPELTREDIKKLSALADKVE